MQVKKFVGETFEEALQAVKREMGPNAIILSRKKVRNSQLGLFGKQVIELTAAIDRRLKNQPVEGIQNNNLTPNKITPRKRLMGYANPNKVANDIVSISREPVRALNKKYIDIQEDDRIEDLVKQNLSKKSNIENNMFEMKKNVDHDLTSTPKALKNLCLNLTVSGVDRKLINEIVGKVTANMNPLLIKRDNYLESYVAKILMDKIKVSGGIEFYKNEPKVLAVIGSTGVGKTTTLAKMAANWKKQGRTVGILTLDTFKIGAIEQLRVYANILELPLKIIRSGSDLSASITEMEKFDLILIDTAGRGKNDLEDIGFMKNLLNINIPIEKHLCLSATMRDEDIYSVIKRFSIMNIDKLLFTKLDETSVYGGILNTVIRSDVPISYFTLGQKVPDDIEVATKERLVDLILKLTAN